jgi:hypothetical protein
MQILGVLLRMTPNGNVHTRPQSRWKHRVRGWTGVGRVLRRGDQIHSAAWLDLVFRGTDGHRIRGSGIAMASRPPKKWLMTQTRPRPWRSRWPSAASGDSGPPPANRPAPVADSAVCDSETEVGMAPRVEQLSVRNLRSVGDERVTVRFPESERSCCSARTTPARATSLGPRTSSSETRGPAADGWRSTTFTAATVTGSPRQGPR